MPRGLQRSMPGLLMFHRCTATTASVEPHENIRTFDQIPRLRSLPVFGTLPFYKFGPYSVQNYADALFEIRAKYGPLVLDDRGWGRKSVLHVFEPEDARTLFANEGVHPQIEPLQETAQLYRQMRQFSLGLGNMNGPEWYRLRSAVQQAMMRPAAVKQYFPLVNQVAIDLANHIETVAKQNADNQVNAFRRLVSRWSLESSGLLVFEKRLGALKQQGDSVDWAHRMLDANTEMFLISGRLKFSVPIWRYLPTPGWRKLVKAEDLFYREARELISDAVARMQQTTQQPSNTPDSKELMFMNYLVNRNELSKEDVTIIAFSLFGDGLNTTAPTLIYNLYCLGANADAQQKLFDEVKSVNENELTGDLLSRLKYLNACIKESFRLYPIGTDVSRIPANDVVLSGYNVPAGTPCEINMGPVLLSADVFDEPTEFRPERWLRDSDAFAGKRVHPFALTPFGHGPRMCAGRRFAEQDLRVALFHLVRRFHINYLGPKPMRQKMESLLLPADGHCKFAFTPRN